jgi:hypothetical protein
MQKRRAEINLKINLGCYFIYSDLQIYRLHKTISNGFYLYQPSTDKGKDFYTYEQALEARTNLLGGKNWDGSS